MTYLGKIATAAILATAFANAAAAQESGESPGQMMDGSSGMPGNMMSDDMSGMQGMMPMMQMMMQMAPMMKACTEMMQAMNDDAQQPSAEADNG